MRGLGLGFEGARLEGFWLFPGTTVEISRMQGFFLNDPFSSRRSEDASFRVEADGPKV